MLIHLSYTKLLDVSAQKYLTQYSERRKKSESGQFVNWDFKFDWTLIIRISGRLGIYYGLNNLTSLSHFYFNTWDVGPRHAKIWQHLHNITLQEQAIRLSLFLMADVTEQLSVTPLLIWNSTIRVESVHHPSVLPLFSFFPA